MKKQRIRSLAICVFRHNDHILVAEGYDPVKGETFFRPLGGGIEFGEINVEVDRESLKYLGTVESIFIFNGTPGHEIVLVYDGALKESKLYEKTAISGKEANGENIRAVWKDLKEFGEGKSILYPTGLVEMLVARTSA